MPSVCASSYLIALPPQTSYRDARIDTMKDSNEVGNDTGLFRISIEYASAHNWHVHACMHDSSRAQEKYISKCR